MSELTFGRQLAAASTVAIAVSVELTATRAEPFIALDALLDGVATRLLKGEQVAEVTTGTAQFQSFRIVGLTSRERLLVDETYSLGKMEARGAWFVPEELTIPAGILQFPFHFHQNIRFAVRSVADDGAKLGVRGCPDALCAWSLIEPLARLLYRPLEHNGFFTTTKVYEERRQTWDRDCALLKALGFATSALDGETPPRVRSAAEQIERRASLLATLAAVSGQEFAASFRASRLIELANFYYAKADRQGRALRRRVLGRGVQPTLVAYFGGDWLSFLDYLGESPHPDDDIVTGLPKVHLFIESKPITEVAAAAGVEPSQAQGVLSSFFRSSPQEAGSPVEERLRLLRAYWSAFDELHARQTAGMPSLWGLIDDTGQFLSGNDPDQDASLYGPTRYLRLLPPHILSEVARLWNYAVIPEAPERIVLSISPHLLMAEAFGPALAFWHGIGLTAWFITQGPYSRTELPGLRDYYARQAAAMAELGAPVAESFFGEIAAAEKLLGPPEQIMAPVSHSTESGLSISISTSQGVRRSGYEKLRDLLTRERRAWAEQYLDTYIRRTCEAELEAAVHFYYRLATDRGKAPTIARFAKHLIGPANHWFGGNTADFYAAFGERCPINPRVVAYPIDRPNFVETAYRGFGGGNAQSSNDDRTHWRAAMLANSALRYAQLEQALARPPTVKEFGSNAIEYFARDTESDPIQVWTWYQQVIGWVKAQLNLPAASVSPST